MRECSLGMRQRLGLALALLGEPELLILDEPTNGLDPAGIHEMGALLRRMPEEHGVTVFLSSHLLAEVEQTAGFIGIVHEGRMVFQGSLDELHASQKRRLRIGVAEAGKAAAFLRASGFDVWVDTEEGSGRLVRSGAAEAALARGMSGRDVRSPYIGVETDDAERVNRLLVENGRGVYHLSFEQESLEDIFLTLTSGQ